MPDDRARFVSEVLDLIGQFAAALDDEIREARQGRGQKYRLHDGRRVAEYQGSFLYEFAADFEVFVPDDSPIEVQIGARRVSGSVVSAEGLSLMLELSEDVGEEVARAELRSEPWHLLEALKTRLSDGLGADSRANLLLAMKTLGRTPPNVRCDVAAARRALHTLGAHANASQWNAIGAALSSEVAFVWGPPGTGKTTTLGLIGRGLHEQNETLLVTSHSNAAVDAATKALAKAMEGSPALTRGEVVRFGTPRLPEVRTLDLVITRQIIRRRHPLLVKATERAESELRQIMERPRRHTSDPERERLAKRLREIRATLSELREELLQKERELIAAARIVACTLSKAAIAPEIFQRRFAAVAVDEASMAYVPQVFFAATLADRRCVVLGDFRQLPPVALADTVAVKTWLKQDVFEHAGIRARVDANQADDRLWLLDTQYRMHPRISGIVNRVVYQGRLRDGPDVQQTTKAIVDRNPEAGHAVAFCDIGPLLALTYREPKEQRYSHFCPFSAAIGLDVAMRLLESGTGEVGIITPYAAQARLIRRLVHGLKVDERVYPATVHRFQGWERDAIIFDVVDTAPLSQPGLLLRGGINSEALRLLNVAMSRPRGKLFVLGDLGYLKSRCAPDSAFMAFLLEVLECGPRRAIESAILTSRSIGSGTAAGVFWYPERREALRAMHADLQAAQREILLTWPDPELEDLLSGEVVARVKAAGVRLAVAAPKLPRLETLRLRYGLEMTHPERSKECLVSIDGQVFWILGWPGGFNRTRPSLRITLGAPTALLADLTGLRQLSAEASVGPAPNPEDGVGRCRVCGGVLWPAEGRYRVYLRCTQHGHSTRLTPEAATRFARIAGIRCERCGSDAVGRQGPSDVFLGCTRYPACEWTSHLRRHL
ncbi:MAG TPA: AAA domain-containing protein [Vicinamibacterales bacterium]|nr:AAA domain-containing protein [Vicinamibacterales bacterium]